MIFKIIVLSISAIFFLYFLDVFKEKKKNPTLFNIIRTIKQFTKREKILSHLNESEVETIIAQGLVRHFADVNTQHPLGG